jgi:hypothetical protein
VFAINGHRWSAANDLKKKDLRSNKRKIKSTRSA